MRKRENVSYVIVKMVHFTIFMTVILKRESKNNILLFSFIHPYVKLVSRQGLYKKKKKNGEH